MVSGTCNVCKEEKSVNLEPTISQLVFGGFPVRMEYRCDDCEKDVADKVDNIINGMVNR